MILEGKILLISRDFVNFGGLQITCSYNKMGDIEELSEEELANDAIYQEPHPSPDGGHGMEEFEQDKEGGFVDNLSFYIEVILAFITFAFVMMSFLFHLFIPASWAPIVNHQINLQQPNTTDGMYYIITVGYINT